MIIAGNSMPKITTIGLGTNELKILQKFDWNPLALAREIDRLQLVKRNSKDVGYTNMDEIHYKRAIKAAHEQIAELEKMVEDLKAQIAEQ